MRLSFNRSAITHTLMMSTPTFVYPGSWLDHVARAFCSVAVVKVPHGTPVYRRRRTAYDVAVPGDHFSDRSDAYARYRPSYPEALFAYLASLPRAHDRAWDCATGNGQAAAGVARFFAEVVATDLSAAQLAEAEPHPNVRYVVATAEASGLPDASVDLVTVAQAIHWFDFGRFYAEVRRVGRPGAILAAWGYGLHTIEPPIDEVLRSFYTKVVGPYWPPERRYLDERYETLPFPFREIPSPPFTLEVRWDLAHLQGYLRTWSATKRYEKARGQDPVAALAPELESAWGDPAAQKLVRWPLYLRVGAIG
jgi:SAM-dependent methyltransferase